MVYPNPASDLVEVEFLEEQIVSVSLYSMEGKKINTSYSSELDVSELSEGMYLLEARTSSGKVAFKRLVKGGSKR